MKRIHLFILLPVFVIVLAAAVPQDYFLLPENFFLHKGDKLDLHLVSGDTFVKQQEISYQPKNTLKFMLFEGSKKTDLTKVAKDSAMPLVDYTMVNTGQALVDMTRIVATDDASRDNFADFLTAENQDKMAEKVKSGNQFRIRQKYTRYIKTLFSVDNHDGSAYEKEMNDDYEIILKDNPYNKKYGDDMSALLKFKGKPAAGVSMGLYIKSTTGKVYTQLLLTDKKGEVSFTMTREGIYMLRSMRIEPTKAKDADYESWWTSYTFPFSSSDEMPNTYKEFGFGNKH